MNRQGRIAAADPTSTSTTATTAAMTAARRERGDLAGDALAAGASTAFRGGSWPMLLFAEPPSADTGSANGWPHWPQKFAPAGLGAPQRSQNMVRPTPAWAVGTKLACRNDCPVTSDASPVGPARLDTLARGSSEDCRIRGSRCSGKGLTNRTFVRTLGAVRRHLFGQRRLSLPSPRSGPEVMPPGQTFAVQGRHPLIIPAETPILRRRARDTTMISPNSGLLAHRSLYPSRAGLWYDASRNRLQKSENLGARTPDLVDTVVAATS
jgi:hypothetical protein